MIRWQGYARENRTAANSHFLAYSAAILALQTSILTDADIKIIEWPRFFIAAGSLAIVSLLLGSLIVLVRLREARLTARVARYRLLAGHSTRSLTCVSGRISIVDLQTKSFLGRLFRSLYLRLSLSSGLSVHIGQSSLALEANETLVPTIGLASPYGPRCWIS